MSQSDWDWWEDGEYHAAGPGNKVDCASGLMAPQRGSGMGMNIGSIMSHVTAAAMLWGLTP